MFLNTVQFAWPYGLLALPLPLLVWGLPKVSHVPAALRVPFFDQVQALNAVSTPLPWRFSWPLVGALLTWCLLILAAMRPQIPGGPVGIPMSGRDILLAVDVSGSMQAMDMHLAGARVDRLTAIKAVAGEFIERRVGDRIGLILFGTHAYLQAPLTFDRKTVRTLLEESAIGFAGRETAIGDAIGLAIKRLRERPSSQRVLILLTDGANTAGTLAPVHAAELAAQFGITIYPIGVGADELQLGGLFGMRRINPSIDLDEPTLMAIAEKTGGRYFRARDGHQLHAIYALLDAIEPTVKPDDLLRPPTELYPWCLAAALFLSVVLARWHGRA